jgi:integrase
MARTPKPWWNNERNAWYVTVKGKRHRLAESKKEADRAFYSLMVAEGEITHKQDRILVADAIEALLANVQRHRPNTRKIYLYSLGPFAANFASRRLDSVTADEALRFVSEYKGRPGSKLKFSDSSRSLMFRHIKTLYRWARDTGLIQINPMHGQDGPWRVAPRARGMTDEEYRTIMVYTKLNRRFKEVLEFLWRTGARPSEIAAIEARHLDARLPIVRLQPTEHKTGAKTGRQREIFMPPDLMDRLRGYAKDRPKGALLRNNKDKPWTQHQISGNFCRVRGKLGLRPDLVIYMARHAFATRLVKPGNDLALVAKVLGHASAEVLQRTYYHPDTKAMAAMVEQENVGEDEKAAEMHREAEEARKDRQRRLAREAYAKRSEEINKRRRDAFAKRSAKIKADTPPEA